jgi:tetratricopeptide (TPR) repeat protein
MVMVAPVAHAAIAAETHFTRGVAAFQQGDYRQAAARFEAARETGLDTPALHYNLGVSYYRLGRFGASAAAFERLADDPTNRGLAHYNLGLVALARDRPDLAREHFETARDAAGDERIRRLAGQRLAELGRPASPRRFSALASASLGYDDNVTLAPDEFVATSDADDTFLQYLAAGTFQLRGDRHDGFQLKGSLLGFDYFDLDDFDQTYLRAGVEWDRRWNGWDTDLAAYADWVYLDGDRFETVITGEAEGLRRLTERTRLRLRYRLSRIEAEAPYDYLTGTRHRAAVEGRYSARVDARLGYELAYNDREDLGTATTFTSVSPTRHQLFAEMAYPFAATWRAEAEVAYRLSRYHDANRDSGTGLDRVREDDRIRLQAGLNRDLPWRLRAFAEYARTVNDSNIAAYDYTANVYRVGVERFF